MESCKTCIHKKVCDLWRKQECQDAKNFFEDECELYDAEEQKKGKWTKAYDGNDGHVKCAACFKTYDYITQAQHFNYCPNCGAKMEASK